MKMHVLIYIQIYSFSCQTIFRTFFSETGYQNLPERVKNLCEHEGNRISPTGLQLVTKKKKANTT